MSISEVIGSTLPVVPPFSQSFLTDIHQKPQSLFVKPPTYNSFLVDFPPCSQALHSLPLEKYALLYIVLTDVYPNNTEVYFFVHCQSGVAFGFEQIQGR